MSDYKTRGPSAINQSSMHCQLTFSTNMRIAMRKPSVSTWCFQISGTRAERAPLRITVWQLHATCTVTGTFRDVRMTRISRQICAITPARHGTKGVPSNLKTSVITCLIQSFALERWETSLDLSPLAYPQSSHLTS